MKRPLKPEELRLWRAVASTVKPAPGRTLPEAPPAPQAPTVHAPHPHTVATARPRLAAHKPSARLHEIEPNRQRRIVHGREEIGARLDLHGLDQDQARATLIAFIAAAQDRGVRAVLVITGRGRLGGGVLRRRLADWLHEPELRRRIAGVSTAHRRHGGEGAFYLALKRP